MSTTEARNFVDAFTDVRARSGSWRYAREPRDTYTRTAQEDAS
ncbi:hypothetical protein [Rhodococcus sp. 06-235-1A]|nr:hypothetical protein [Rhodococcus sp. 06-235-1A]